MTDYIVTHGTTVDTVEDCESAEEAALSFCSRHANPDNGRTQRMDVAVKEAGGDKQWLFSADASIGVKLAGAAKAAEGDKVRRILSDLSGAATAVASVLPEPGGIVARVIAAALGVASAMLSQGATPQQAIAAIKRVRHIDTSADDAAVDAKVDAKPIGKRYQEMRPVMQAVPAVDEPSPFDRQAAPVCGVCGHKGSMRLSGRGAWACVNPCCESPPQAKRHEPGEGD